MTTSAHERPMRHGVGAQHAGGRHSNVPIVVPPEVRETISVLIIDDEHTLRESCASLLRSEGYGVTLAARGEEGAGLIRRKDFDIILADLFLPDVSGMDLLEIAREHSPDSIYIIMTGNPSVESSIEGLRAGAWDYLPKPFSASHLQIVMGRAAHAITVARESRPRAAGGDSGAAAGDAGILGTSKALQKAIALAQKVASTDASVFLTGESGTGKELLAHFIHDRSRRSSRPFVPLNCAAVPESLLESEMFGHLRGAFTGAVQDKEGLLEAAHGGTLFLDELTEMPVGIQAKLLRVIQDGIVRRVGSTRTDAVVNVRFVAATNIDPAEAVRDGYLRKDLHYRLRVVPIHLPPLRERPEDIQPLAEHFLRHFWDRHRGHDGSAPPELSEQAVRALRSQPWPGNVRELKNVVEHLTVLVEAGATVSADDIPFLDDHVDEMNGKYSLKHVIRGADYHTARERALADFERQYLEYVVGESNGNISDAARMAGVDRTTLYRLMEKHGTNRQDLIEAAAS